MKKPYYKLTVGTAPYTSADLRFGCGRIRVEVSDARRLVQAVQAKGVRVTVVSTLKSQPPMLSDDLRRQADAYIDLADRLDDWARPRTPSASPTVRTFDRN